MSRAVRGLTAALNGNGRFAYKTPQATVDNLIIGGGVVGLAIAQRVVQRNPGGTCYLVERHGHAGQETSSRNSEVVHGGIYYPPNSLKTRLCLRGRHLLYDYCSSNNVPFKKIGKLVVGRKDQREYIENLHRKAQSLPWPVHSPEAHDESPAPTKVISGEEAREMEPDLSKDIACVVWSPETGIIDSRTLMETLEKDITDSSSGELVYGTRVVRVDAHPEGWVVQLVTGDSSDSEAILARTLINSSGLSGALVINSLLPSEDRIPMYYARGSYASYNGPGVGNVKRLLYPVPDNTGKEGHAFQSLGTHLTLDMNGKIRFGPDLEWIDAPEPSQDGEIDTDFWAKHLVPDDSLLDAMHGAVARYLPGVSREGMQPDYAGFRPKLVAPPNGGFNDFVIRIDFPSQFLKDQGGTRKGRGNPMITLLGIESPGLTSSLAIAELVVDDILGGI